jgi:hypothetical protein
MNKPCLRLRKGRFRLINFRAWLIIFHVWFLFRRGCAKRKARNFRKINSEIQQESLKLGEI